MLEVADRQEDDFDEAELDEAGALRFSSSNTAKHVIVSFVILQRLSLTHLKLPVLFLCIIEYVSRNSTCAEFT